MKTYELTLKIKAPVLSGEAGSQRFGLDSSAIIIEQEDGAHQGLPGSLIKGNLRDMLASFESLLSENASLKSMPAGIELLTTEIIEQWFGVASKDEFYTAKRGQISMDRYWICEQPIKQKSLRNRIKIDAETGVVKKGAVLFIEAPYPTGKLLTFTGKINVNISKDNEYDTFEYWVKKALHFISAVGAYKSVGFGQVISEESSFIEIPMPPVQQIELKCLDKISRIGLALYLEPFCIAKPHGPDSNHFETESSIAGNIIKALLADQLTDDEKEKFQFDNWIITHAFANRPLSSEVEPPQRVGQIPASLFYNDSNDQFFDAAYVEKPDDFVDKENNAIVPTFATDWKGSKWEKAEALTGQYKDTNGFQRALQIHTAIDQTSGQSKEGALFSMELIEPQEAVWYADIDLSLIDETIRKKVISWLHQRLTKPLPNLGKTKANVSVKLLPEATKQINTENEIIDSFKNDQIAIVLQTEALLFDQPTDVPPTGGSEALKKWYAAYWSHASGDQLTLSHYYATQSIKGGDYLYKKFKSKSKSGADYQPYWLTNPGSVFVLTANNKNKEKVAELIKTWLTQGLPQPNTQLDNPLNRDWKYNPFINRHGFGEISLLKKYSDIEQLLPINKGEK